MRLAHTLSLLLLLNSVGTIWASPPGEDSPSDLALKEKRLTKVSNVYVLEAEKPVLAKLKDARSSFIACEHLERGFLEMGIGQVGKEMG